ncbi:MAG: type IX secretion system membrane protein PorP/SprF [Cyclobacteriaceae bacterium]
MKVFLIIIFFLINIKSYSQSNGLISHYMFNPLIINPAYAGFDQALTLNALAKIQWAQVEGSPRTQIFSLHTPVEEKVSLGLILANDQMGPLNQKGIFASYAYRIPLQEGFISMGLQAGTTIYDLQEENINLLDPQDPVFTTNLHNLVVPNFGSGFLYSSKNFYLGVAIPQLFRISAEENISYSLQRQNVLLHGSYSFALSNDLQVNPNTLINLRNGHPAEINLGVNFLIRKVLWTGILYRNLNTFTFLAKIHVNPQLNLGYAYDYHSGEIRSMAHGSHEFLISYQLNHKKDKLVLPKFF